ncbi:MAG: IS66 family transposase [Deltaproteobacteria bacterium]|nr:IS66 family transposase [Deltaproteobacteria bacterium]
MNIDVSTLPDSPDDLKALISDLHGHVSLLDGQITTLKEAHDKETDILLEQIRHLRAQLFGRKSDKVYGDSGAQPLPLFDMPEPDPEAQPEESVEVPAHTRKKSGRKPLPEDLPRIERIHDIAEADKVCGCGCELSRIGEDVSEQLDIIPARIQVIRHIRPKYACKSCQGVADGGPAVKIAPVEPTLIPKSLASPGLVAFILTGKFVDHLPFYRQEKQFSRLGVDISRTTMCNWAMQAASACRPLLNLLQDTIREGRYLNIDETTVQVLKEPGRSPTRKSYMWIFRRGDPDYTVLLYQYHPTRSGDVVRDFLDDFTGVVQTDGYSGYDFLDRRDGILHIGCWAHARRKFMDVIKAQGKNRKSGSADKALSYIKKLYRLEQEAQRDELPTDQIYRMRQEKALPILEDFKKWLGKKATQTPPQGLLGKAVSYTLKQWDRLIGYSEDGCLKPDNNMAENSIRPFVLGRKNWLFSGTPEGAEASALLYSLIETARANGLEPYRYLRYIFDKLPAAHSLEDYETLLPWNAKAVMPPTEN